MGITMKKFGQPYTDEAEMTQFTYPVATTAELADIADPINTENKFPGKWVLNTTTSLMVYAIGGAAGDDWHASTDGLSDHSPA